MKESIIRTAQFLTMPFTVFMLAIVSIIIPGLHQEIIAFIAVLIAAFVKKFADN